MTICAIIPRFFNRKKCDKTASCFNTFKRIIPGIGKTVRLPLRNKNPGPLYSSRAKPYNRNMKTVFLLLTACLITTGLCAANLTIEVLNPPADGSTTVLLFNSPDRFGDLRNPVCSARFAPGEALVLPDVPPGDYAVAVYHDENGNGELDKNFIGIPREPVGFANTYSPKGPPSYRRAAITVTGDPQSIPVSLSRPLGERGRIGAGLGLIISSSPYRDADGGTLLPIPAITYTGERLQIFGPQARFGLLSTGPIKLSAVARFRPGAYEEDDSPALIGMGDRDATLMAGAALKADLPSGLNTSLTVAHDLLDRIGGTEASFALNRSFQAGNVRLTPSASLNWTAASLANHDYGVPSANAAPARPAHDTGDVITFETGCSALAELGENWWIAASLGIELLPDDVTDSPIVSKSLLFKSFLAINYVF